MTQQQAEPLYQVQFNVVRFDPDGSEPKVVLSTQLTYTWPNELFLAVFEAYAVKQPRKNDNGIRLKTIDAALARLYWNFREQQ